MCELLSLIIILCNYSCIRLSSYNILATKVTGAMATHGKIGPFNPTTETWSSYSERLRYYFAANDTPDDKKHAILLTVCGPSTFQLLRSLAKPSSLDDKSFKELTGILARHYDPVPSTIIQRYKFHTRERGPSETVANYLAELKAIAEHCNFGNSLHEMIRDRLACGVNDSRIQRSLLLIKDFLSKQTNGESA